MIDKIVDRRVLLATLWVFVLFNMIFADIFSFMNAEFLQQLLQGRAEEVVLTPNLLLVLAIVTEIPMLMVLLARVLPYRLNRWLNIAAALFTIVYIIGGGSTVPHYLFIASVEVIGLLAIIGYAWTWQNDHALVNEGIA